MLGIRRHDSVFVAVYDDEEDDDDRVCPYCKKYRFELNKLGPLLLDEDEEKPADFDKWLQCRGCYKKFKKREVKRETRVTDFVEVDEDGDGDSGYAEAAFKPGRKSRLERYLEIQEQQQPNNPKKDPDALRAIKQGKKVVNFQEYEQRDGNLTKL